MEDSSKEIINFYKKNIEPYIAIFILTLLIVGCILLYQDNQLKKEISENCGWEDEKYQCYCEKQFIDGIKEEIEQFKKSGGLNLENATMDG